MNIPPICPYCGGFSELVTGGKVYPHRNDLSNLKFWFCDKGHEAAYVGCHKNSKNNAPLGRLADADLRKAKSQAHGAFDPLWRSLDMFESRKAAYKWLSEQMNKDPKETHIGMFDEMECYEVIDHCNEFLFPRESEQ